MKDIKGHGEKLSRRQGLFLSCLLVQATVEAAAANTGISASTASRWMKDPQFQAQYRAACHQIIEFSISNMQAATKKAVDTLMKNLDCGQPWVEVRAALGIIDQAFRAVEIRDFEKRLSAVERRTSNTRGWR